MLLSKNFEFLVLRSLRSYRDLARECSCFGREAVNTSGVVRALVKCRVEFPPAQIR